MYILLIILLVIFCIIKSKEHFVQEPQINFTYDYNDIGYRLDYNQDLKLKQDPSTNTLVVSNIDPKRQRYLQFLSNINDKFKEAMPKTGPFRGSCDDNLNEQTQKRVLSQVFEKMNTENKDFPRYRTEHSKKDPKRGYDCVGMASHVCEMTNPYFYLSESNYFPPPWTVKTYKSIDYPTHTNLSCFNKNFDCCKSSLS
jgi:hypothetical protein